MVVKLTQEQADYLKTFQGKKETAIYYIARSGWVHFIEDGLGKIYEDNEKKPFEQDEYEKMLNALINGYEVAVPKFKFYNFSDITGIKRLYYVGKMMELTANYNEAKHIEKNSKEYVALENLGFYKDQV